jgi:hypothetical protein
LKAQRLENQEITLYRLGHQALSRGGGGGGERGREREREGGREGERERESK